MENKENKMIRVVEYEVFKKFTDTVTAEFEKLVAENETMIHEVNGLIERYKVMDEAHRRKVWIDKSDEDLQEAIAECMHKIWGGWMRYLINETSTNDDGTATIPKWIVERWTSHMSMEYKDLPINDKDDILIDAKRILDLL